MDDALTSQQLSQTSVPGHFLVGDPAVLEHRAKLDHFYMRYAELWPGTLTEAYDILGIHGLPQQEIAHIRDAAAAICRVYKRATPLLKAMPDESLLKIGLSHAMLPLCRIASPAMCDVVLGRLDLVKTRHGYRLLEFNADMPGLVVETYPITARICEQFGKVNPNSEALLATNMQRAVEAALRIVGKTGNEPTLVAFASLGKYAADTDLAKYLMGLVDLPETIRKRFVAIETLRLGRDGLLDSDGNIIDVLYRHCPFEYFLSQLKRNGGNQSLEWLSRLVRNHKLVLINPPSACLLENKAAQAIIWGLHELSAYFTGEEQSLIERYMLPTHLKPSLEGRSYVVKPIYGREGDTISIVNQESGETLASKCRTHSDQPKVYQEYVQLPTLEAMTELGPKLLNVVASCFLVCEQPMGIGLRAGQGITDDSWWFVPACQTP